MATMIPEYRCGGWFNVETTEGGDSIPDDLILAKGETGADVPAILDEYPTKGREFLSRFEPFLSGSMEGLPEWVHGWGVRLSMPGYTDCTPWAVFDSKQEARDYVVDTWEVDPDTGDALEDEDEDVCENCGDLVDRHPTTECDFALPSRVVEASVVNHMNVAQATIDAVVGGLPAVNAMMVLVRATISVAKVCGVEREMLIALVREDFDAGPCDHE